MNSKNMKYQFFNLCLGLLSLTMLSGCYQDIDLDRYKGQNGENLLTINSVVNPDSTVSALATRTYFFSDIHNRRDYVNDLDIRLYLNGEEKGTLVYDPGRQMYFSDVHPAENDTVELRTRYRDSDVSCSGVVPPAVKIESVKASRQGPMSIYTNRDYIVTYEITFTDDPRPGNRYFLNYDTSDWRKGLSMGVRDYTYEYVFQQLANRVNANLPGWEPYSPDGLPFTDDGINGKRHTLVVKEIIQGSRSLSLTNYTEMGRRFRLFSISEDYYRYLLSVLYNDPMADGLHGGMIDLGLSEPMKYFSNINGGVGIFATYSLDEAELDVIQICGRFPK